MADDQDQKQVRGKNWTEGEVHALTKAISDDYPTLYGKFTPTLTKKKKLEAWAKVVAAVNAVSNVVRTPEQCKEKYKGLKKKAKDDAAHNKKEIIKTGGGSADLREINEVSDVILANVPSALISGIEGGFDTSRMALISGRYTRLPSNIHRLHRGI